MYENKWKVLVGVVLRSLYGVLIEYLLWYKNFRSDIEEIGFEFDHYYPDVVNQVVNKKNTLQGFTLMTLYVHIYTQEKITFS